MLKRLEQFDAWLIRLVQESYLWLLDRTGIYAATLSFIMIATSILIGMTASGTGMKIVLMIGLLINALILGQRYILQDKALVTAFNAQSLLFRSVGLRHLFTGFLIGTLFACLIDLDVVGVFNGTLCILYNYSYLILIRDRDKKPFFEAAPKLAPEAT